jgi:type II secretory pathway pseudopilin PulG
MDPTRRNDHLSSARRHLAGDNHRAFTLVELLVVLGTVAILTVLLLPALASTQPASAKAFQCLNNMRQMAVAWTLYAGDNHDQLVLNTDLYRISGGKGGNPSWCQGIEDWSLQLLTPTRWL